MDFHLQFFQILVPHNRIDRVSLPRHDAISTQTHARPPVAWLAAAVFTLSCKYFYEAIMAEDDDEDHGKRE